MTTKSNAKEAAFDKELRSLVTRKINAEVKLGGFVVRRETADMRYSEAVQWSKDRPHYYRLNIAKRIMDSIEAGEVSTDKDSWDEGEAFVETMKEYRELEAEINEKEKEYTGWNRFYVVLANNGHIHSSMNCGTCNRGGKRTSFTWAVEMSGLEVSEAVEKYGPALCSRCFPEAPLDWTIGEIIDPSKPKACPGSGRYSDKKSRRYGYVICGQCNSTVKVTRMGVMRKHNPPKGK